MILRYTASTCPTQESKRTCGHSLRLTSVYSPPPPLPPDTLDSFTLSSVKAQSSLHTQAPEELRPHLARVEPFPAYPVFAAARARHEQLRDAAGVRVDLVSFAARVANMPPGMRGHSLHLLNATLDGAGKGELLADLDGSQPENRLA